MYYKKCLAVLAVCGIVLTGCSSPVEDGTKLLEEKNYSQAIESFDEAIEKWDGKEKYADAVAEAYRGKGIAYWEQNDYNNAKEAFLKALDEGTEKTGTIYNFLGICEMNLENPAGAIQYFEQGLACEGNSSELAQEMEFNQISAYEQLKDWENAKVKIAEYTAKYPDDAEAAKEAEFLATR